MEQTALIYEFFMEWGPVNALLTLAGFLVFWLTRLDKFRRDAKAANSDFIVSKFVLDEMISFFISGLLTLFGSPAIHQIQNDIPALVYMIIGWSGGSIFKYAYEKFMANLDSIPILKNMKK